MNIFSLWFQKIWHYVNSDTAVLYLAIFVPKTESEYCYLHFLLFSIALSTLNKNSFAYEKRINKQPTKIETEIKGDN